MYIQDFPFCCTAKVVVDLGGTDTAEDGYTKYDYEEFMRELDLRVKACADGGYGLVTATTTTDQVDANEWLKEYGFMCAGPYAKRNHPESGLFLWWYPLKGVYGEEG